MKKYRKEDFKTHFAKSNEKQLVGLTCTEEEYLLMWKTLQRFCGLLWAFCACNKVILLTAASQKCLRD